MMEFWSTLALGVILGVAISIITLAIIMSMAGRE